MIVVVLITYIWREIQIAEEVANKAGKQVESKQNLSLKLIKEFHLISIWKIHLKDLKVVILNNGTLLLLNPDSWEMI